MTSGPAVVPSAGAGPESLPISDARTGLIRRRALVLGAALILFNVYWVIRLEKVMFGPYVSTISLFPNAVFLLALLILLNAGIRSLSRRHALNPAELLTIYTMVAVSTGLAGLDGITILSQLIPHGGWFATPSNGWSSFLGAFPKWLVVTDHQALRGHYLGNSTFYTAHNLLVWARPILAWTIFFTILMWTAMCMNVLVRKQWQDRERLTFPIVYLPLQMVDSGSGLFRNRLMWVGFAIAAGIGLFNGIAFLYPSVPILPIDATDLKPLFTAKPWSAIDWFPVTFYPLAIGLGFLLPVDLLFSCWFFFLFWKAQMVVSNVFAWDVTPDFPFIYQQGFGAVVGLALYYLYSSRQYLREAWGQAFGAGGVGRWALGVNGRISPRRHGDTGEARPPTPRGEQLESGRSWDSPSSVSERKRGTGVRGQSQTSSSAPPGVGGRPTPNPQGPTPAGSAPIPYTLHPTPSPLTPEALSYRAAFLGLAGGFLGLVVFSMAAGMSLWLAAAFFILYLAIVLVVLRIRAELGPPVHDLHFIGPDRMFPQAFGVAGWRQSDLAVMTLYFTINRAHRGDVYPVGLEGLYAAHKNGWNPRRMFQAVMLAGSLSAFACLWLHEHQAYQLGAAAKFNQGYGHAQQAFEKMAGWVDGTQDAHTNMGAVWAMAAGFLSCVVLLACRTRFAGFPFHPIGYVISSNWSIHLLWVPMLIAWVAKSLTLRYGGLPAYRRFLPFFLGLILGDCVQGSIWGLVSLLLNMRTYNFFGG